MVRSAFEIRRLRSAAFKILALLEHGCSTPSVGALEYYMYRLPKDILKIRIIDI